LNDQSPNLYEVPTNDRTSARKRDIPLVLMQLSRWLLRLFGWRVTGHLPDYDKLVLAAGPHTSNMDGFIMVFTAWAFGAKPDWMVKKELDKGLFGVLIRVTGGIPIDRASRQNTVKQVVDCIQERERIMLVVAPEGTRKKTDHWKTGFYWIAYHADVPIVCGFIDYKRKLVGVGPTIMPTGDIRADMEKVWAFYRQITPRFPENYSDMRLRDNAEVGSVLVESPAETVNSANPES
jgi:1-acyl-sn-glycerol-3-phosphate acyltransferase